MPGSITKKQLSISYILKELPHMSLNSTKDNKNGLIFLIISSMDLLFKLHDLNQKTHLSMIMATMPRER